MLPGQKVDEESVSQLLEGWLRRSISEYHKVEKVAAPFEGNIAVLSAD